MRPSTAGILTIFLSSCVFGQTYTINTFAGGLASPGFSGDNGPATSAQFSLPSGVAVDSAGSLYIADTQSNRIRKVSNGVITTVAGGGTSGLGDNGLATHASLQAPEGVAVDAAGNLYIADTGRGRIREVSNGIIGGAITSVPVLAK